MIIYMENKCELLSSKGILKSCCLHSDSASSSSPQELTYRVDKENAKIRKTPSVYIPVASLKFFCKSILPALKAPVVLVTGDSDLSIPNKRIDCHSVARILGHPMIKRWYCQNLCCRVQNLYPLPIGLDYHTVSYMEKWGEEITKPIDQELQIKNIKQKSEPFWEREYKCYINFQSSMHHKSGEPVEYADVRKAALQYINKDICYFQEGVLSRGETWTKQAEYAFVVSPPGNGIDCHRTWEALNLGCIPIIIRMHFTDDYMEWQLGCYDDLPVLIVNKWEDLSQELLDDTIEIFREREFDYDKLTLKYWIDKIHE